MRKQKTEEKEEIEQKIAKEAKKKIEEMNIE